MKKQIYRKTMYNPIIYHTLLEYQSKGVQKLNKYIVRKIARQANVSPSRIWVVLESQKLGNKDIPFILAALTPEKQKAHKISKASKIKPRNNLEDSVQETIVSEEASKATHYTKKPKKPSREFLYELYAKKGISTVKIAKKYHRGRGTIYVWLRSYGIPRHIVSVKRPRSLGRPSKETLYREYIEEKKSLAEMTKIHSAGKSTIRAWLKRDGIPIRTLSEELLKNKRLPSGDELRELYINQQISIKKIAEMYHTGKRIIKRLLCNNNIPLRSYEDALSIAALKGKRLPTETELYHLYVEREQSLDEIAKFYGLSHTPIMRWFKKYGIKTRTQRQANQAWRRKKEQRALEAFDYEKYKGLRGLIELFGKAADDEEAGVVVKGITSKYLNRLRNLCETIGEENIEGELCLIAKDCKNKLEPLILRCLYNAYLRIGKDISEIDENIPGQLEALQKVFSNELRKVYIKYAIERRNNNHTVNEVTANNS